MSKMIEIDASRKIEETARDSVLAMAGNVNRTLLIPAASKREAFEHLKTRRKPRSIACYQIFAAGLFLLMRPSLPVITRNGWRIQIDIEYTAQDDKIKGMLLRYIRGEGHCISKNAITFETVGKRSPAHVAAWRVQRGLEPPDHTVQRHELLELL